MRVRRTKLECVILSAALVAIGVWAAPDRASRLVSVQQLPDGSDWCMADESSATNPSSPSPDEKILFSALRRDPYSTLVFAAQFTTRNVAEQERQAAEARNHPRYGPDL